MFCEIVVARTKPANGVEVTPDLENIRFVYPLPRCVFSDQFTSFIAVSTPLPNVSKLTLERDGEGTIVDDNYVVVETDKDFVVVPRDVWKKLVELISLYLTQGTLKGGILLYGVPGTGKSFIATKLLGYVLGLPVVLRRPTDFITKYVGEPYTLLTEFIDTTLLSKKPSLIVFDEGERLLLKRGGGVGESEKLIEDNMKNILLERLQQYIDGEYPSLLVVTTNASINDMDDAMLRRFTWKIYFPPYASTVYEFIARRVAQTKSFKVNGQDFDVTRMSYYASSIGLSVAEFRTMLATGSVQFLRAKSVYPRRLVPYNAQDPKRVFDITKLLFKYEKGGNIKLLTVGALFSMTALVASYFTARERRPVYLLEHDEKTMRYGSEDVITLLKQDNKPVGIFHIHSNLNVAKHLLVERLLEEQEISFVVMTSFDEANLPVQTLKLLPKVDLTRAVLDIKDIDALAYTLVSYYGLRMDEGKLMDEMRKAGDYRKALDVVEKILMVSS